MIIIDEFGNRNKVIALYHVNNKAYFYVKTKDGSHIITLSAEECEILDHSVGSDYDFGLTPDGSVVVFHNSCSISEIVQACDDPQAHRDIINRLPN